MNLKTLVSLLSITVLIALSAAGQTPTPTTPITVLAMAGTFYDGSSHHMAGRLGAFLPTGQTNWLGLVADVGFAKDSPASPKYVLSGKFIQKAATITLGASKIDAYLVASVGGVVTGSTVSDVVKGAGGLVTSVAANAGSTFGYQAATGGGLNIKLGSWLRLHPFVEYARGSLTGSQVSVGLLGSGEFQIQR